MFALPEQCLPQSNVEVVGATANVSSVGNGFYAIFIASTGAAFLDQGIPDAGAGNQVVLDGITFQGTLAAGAADREADGNFRQRKRRRPEGVANGREPAVGSRG